MKKLVCIFGLAFVITFVSCTNNVEYKQATEVYGQVVDNQTGTPLDSIIIILEFTGCYSKIYATDTTDNLGNYKFDNIPNNPEHRRLRLIVNNNNGYYEYQKLLDLLVDPISYKIIRLIKI